MSAPQSIELSNVSNVANLRDENDGANGEYLTILPSETDSPNATTLDSAHATYDAGPAPDRVLVLDAAAQHTQQPGPLPSLGGKAGASAADAPKNAGQGGDALVPVPSSQCLSGPIESFES